MGQRQDSSKASHESTKAGQSQIAARVPMCIRSHQCSMFSCARTTPSTSRRIRLRFVYTGPLRLTDHAHSRSGEVVHHVRLQGEALPFAARLAVKVAACSEE